MIHKYKIQRWLGLTDMGREGEWVWLHSSQVEQKIFQRESKRINPRYGFPLFDCRKPISQCGVEELQVERRRTQRTAPTSSSTRVSWSGGTFLVGEFSSSTVVLSGLLNPGIRMFKERRLGWFAKEGRLSSLLLPAPSATPLMRKPQLRRRS